MAIKTSKNIIQEIKTYWDVYTFETINQRLKRKLRKAAYKIADQLVDEVMSQYDFRQVFKEQLGGDKIIITSVLTKKKKGW